MNDLISRQKVIDKLKRLIEVERLQGTDEMGYGRERVSAYECMLSEIESECLYPPVRDFVSRGYLLSIANKDNAYGYVSAHEIINAPVLKLDLDIPQKDNRWIPVSERLPEVNQNVLATTKWGEVTIAERLNLGPDYWFIHEGNTNAHTEDIVVWQPLPEPYKGGE